MKKILTGLILMTSASSFAATNLTCGIFKSNAAGTPIKEIVLDLEKSQDYKSVFTSEKQTFTATVNAESVSLGFSDANGRNSTVLSIDILRNMEYPQSVGVISFSNDESKNYTAVCYQTGDSTTGPWGK